jgi:hypothetical protein
VKPFRPGEISKPKDGQRSVEQPRGDVKSVECRFRQTGP